MITEGVRSGSAPSLQIQPTTVTDAGVVTAEDFVTDERYPVYVIAKDTRDDEPIVLKAACDAAGQRCHFVINDENGEEKPYSAILIELDKVARTPKDFTFKVVPGKGVKYVYRVLDDFATADNTPWTGPSESERRKCMRREECLKLSGTEKTNCLNSRLLKCPTRQLDIRKELIDGLLQIPDGYIELDFAITAEIDTEEGFRQRIWDPRVVIRPPM